MMVPVKRKIGFCYTRWHRLSHDHCGRSSDPPCDPLTGRVGPCRQVSFRNDGQVWGDVVVGLLKLAPVPSTVCGLKDHAIER